MKIETYMLGPMQTNCYLAVNEETKELAVVDPAACPKELIDSVRTNGYRPAAILLTHGHFDHILGIDGWIRAFSVPVYLHEAEAGLLADPKQNLSEVFGTPYAYSGARGLTDGSLLEAAGFRFRVIHTPGHTAGSCCYYEEEAAVLFSGDTLFCRSVGRTDFPTGDAKTLTASIREKLFCLPEDVKVFPGHDRATCIADEKKHNPFV